MSTKTLTNAPLPKRKAITTNTSRLTDDIVAYLEPHRKEILDAAITAAKLGDPVAIRQILSYFPPNKAPEQMMSIPGLVKAITLQDKGDAILNGLAQCHLGFDSAEKALKILASYATIVSASSFEARLRALEEGKPFTPCPTLANHE
jgi:hypothetical protein